jgi:hypothetical protein
MLEPGLFKGTTSSIWENDDTNDVCLELKKHMLEFTMGQLSHDMLIQYRQTTQNPGKLHGTLFPVVLHWY